MHERGGPYWPTRGGRTTGGLDIWTIEIPGGDPIRLEHLVLDINGTLTNRGELIDGVAERLARLAGDLTLHIVTADTLGTAIDLGARLGVSVTIIQTGADKAAFVRRIGAQGTVAIGNGRNDEAMLRASRLGIAIIGPEGAAGTTLVVADVVCRSITDALDLLLDRQALFATIRA
jgi:soluble P-type ATPase